MSITLQGGIAMINENGNRCYLILQGLKTKGALCEERKWMMFFLWVNSRFTDRNFVPRGSRWNEEIWIHLLFPSRNQQGTKLERIVISSSPFCKNEAEFEWTFWTAFTSTSYGTWLASDCDTQGHTMRKRREAALLCTVYVIAKDEFDDR